MKKNRKNLLSRLLMLIILAASLSSCRTTAPSVDYKALVHASKKLGMDIEYKDNQQLYLEAADWLGVRYRSGGTTKRGVDCSGLTSEVYRKVYKTNLSRTTSGQMKQCSRKSKHKLKEGDLVFFSSRNSKKKVAHVGIYLKDGQFVHASSSKGVIVSNLNSTYYSQYWMRGGRVKKK